MLIAEWGKFQGYKKRGPQWIKLYLSLIDQPKYLALPLVGRAVLPVLWITAARTSEKGELTDDLQMLSVLCHLPQDELKQSLPFLVHAGFVTCDRTVAWIATSVSGEKSREETEQRQTAVATESVAEQATGLTAFNATLDAYCSESERLRDEVLFEFSEAHGKRFVRPELVSEKWREATHGRIKIALIELRKKKAEQAKPRGETPMERIDRIEAERKAKQHD